MKTTLLLAFSVLLAAVPCSAAGADESVRGGWSADLLHQILNAGEPGPAPDAKPAPGTPAAAGQEMILHTYRLTHLRVGEAGKVRNVLAILGNLLPPGSSMNPDVPANSVHVLTTPAAHKALWDYLSAVDVPESSPQPASVAMPDDVKSALKKLADAGDQSARLVRALDALQNDVNREFAAIDARQRGQSGRLLAGGAVFTLIMTGTLVWMLRRRTAIGEPSASPANTALALAPDQLATALTPVHDRMRSDMLGLLNEVAIKLQAQHNEQQKLVREQQQQLVAARDALADERRQFISEAGTMVVQAVERVDATTARLARQQDKVAELVQELQNTVRELDETKDSLRNREVELEQERAKIAALSLLLEEGAPLTPPATNGHAPAASLSAPALLNGNGAGHAALSSSLPCTIPNHSRLTAPTMPDELPPPPPPRYTFLPPDHPES